MFLLFLDWLFGLWTLALHTFPELAELFQSLLMQLGLGTLGVGTLLK
jgi:hypothetical protein